MDDIIDSMDMSLSRLWERVKDREAWSGAVYEKESDITEQLNNRKLYFRKCGVGKCED